MKILGDDDDDWLEDTAPRTPGQKALRLLRKLARGLARLLLAAVAVFAIVWIFIGLGYLPAWASATVIVVFLVLLFIYMKGVHKWTRK